MEKDNKDKLTTAESEKKNVRNYRKDAPGAVSGINSPVSSFPPLTLPFRTERGRR